MSVGRARRRWSNAGLGVVILVAVACLVVGLVAGALASPMRGQPRLTAPLGVQHAPTGDTAGQVWSGRMQGGVPVGWAHSQAGAVQAATNYTVVLSSELLFDEAKRRLAVDTIAAPEARAALQRQLAVTARTDAAVLTRGLGAGGPGASLDPAKVVFQTIPVRYRVDRYDGSHARIALWMTGVAGYQDSSLLAQQAWGITTVQLQWADGDWKETSAVVRDGPTPAPDVDAAPTSSWALVSQAQGFAAYRYGLGP